MKAIILERRGDEAAVLCEDGTFANRRVNGEVGETVELSAEVVAFPTKKKTRWARSAVAAALALSVTGGTLGYMGGTASAYVSLDVEDSAIELTVNHFGRVIAVNAVSEDAEALAESLSAEVKHQTVEKALNHTMIRLRDEGYLGDENDTVIAGVTSDNTKRAAKLTQTVESAAAGHTAYVTESSRAEREQAKEQKISAGRFGMERDHVELPAVKDGNAEPQMEAAVEPSTPASGTESSVPAETQPVEPPAQETPQQETNREPANAPRNDAPREQREEMPAQQNDQPDTQEQPQVEERPNAEESRPSRESGQPPEQEQPQRGEEMQEQPQQGNERQEQPPQEQIPQGNEQPQETDQTGNAPSPFGDQPEMQDGDIGAPPDSGNGPMSFAPHGDMRNSGEHGVHGRKDMGPDSGTEKRGPL
ncbi:MAG: hypothetical protein IKN81_11485 [Oscillospiraceae bacterium]|nr:hypothetical protein [Oscillospiraceae bacterium]